MKLELALRCGRSWHLGLLKWWWWWLTSFYIYFYFMCLGILLAPYTSVHHVCILCPHSQKRVSVRSLGTGVRGSCEGPCGCWDLNSGPGSKCFNRAVSVLCSWTASPVPRMPLPHVYTRYLQTPEEGVGSHGTRVTDGHELPCGHWTLNPGPPLPLTDEPSP